MLKKENEDLENKLATKTREEGQAVTSAMQRLEEEVRFLKRHHDIEITMMKE
jgi:cell division protein ZapA (FtsZ GTPase activity inhibitor)